MKRWIVAIAGLACVLGPGALYSFSFLSTPLTAAFGWSSNEVSWAFALANLFLAVGGIVGGALSDRFGPRFIAVTGIALWSGGYALCATLASSHSLTAFLIFYGVIAGTGCGMTYISALSSVLKWFPTARGFGGGLIIMGFGMGSFVYNNVVKPSQAYATVNADTQAYVAAKAIAFAQHLPFDAGRYALSPASVAALMSIFQWSAVAFALLGIVTALLLSNPPQGDPAYEAVGVQSTPGVMLGDPRFYVLWAMLFLNVFGGVMVIGNLVPLMHDVAGMSATQAASLYAFLALFNGVGRLFWGWLSDRVNRRLIIAILFGGQAVAFFGLDTSKDPAVVAVSIGLMLFCYGGGFGVMPAFNSDYFGTKLFGINYGLQLSAWGIAAVLGTFMVSAMKALSGSYVGLMQPVSIALMVAMFFPLIIESAKQRSAEADSLSATA